MYEDKLDGEVPPEFYDRKRKEWRLEQEQIAARLAGLRGDCDEYVDEGIRLIELAKAAASLYERQDTHEQGRLVRYMCSNSPWRDGRLHPEYRKPFDLLASANVKWSTTKAVSDGQADIRTEWLPFVDAFRTELAAPSPDMLSLFQELGATGRTSTLVAGSL